MTLSATRTLVDDAAGHGTAVLAFNVITLEHAEGIVAGAELARTAVILQVSENAIRFHEGRFAPLLAACRQLAEDSPARVAVHLDHITDAGLAERLIAVAPDLGVSSIMVDAAHHEYEENVGRTRALADRAHARGLWVEAELGAIGGKNGAHAPGVRTDPGEAAAFVACTGVDGLAVAVGSSHAMTTRAAELDLLLVEELARAVPVPLVLHGSSGVPETTLTAAVRAGIRKVNIGTALNLAFTREVRAVLAGDAAIVDPRHYLAPGRERIAESVAALCRGVASPAAAGASAGHPYPHRSEES